MKIISFAWTTPALLAGRKTVTRRHWNDGYAARFHPGEVVQAYDKNPRIGGKCVAHIRIVSITHEPMSAMPDSDFEAEGFAYLREQGKNLPFDFEQWRNSGDSVYVIRIELVREEYGNPRTR